MSINHKTIDAARGRRAEGMGAGGELYSPSGDSHIKRTGLLVVPFRGYLLVFSASRGPYR